ncbi:MAG: hypothetical protein HY370_06400 [Proteobacteria bacterium]|nr:hypothetical protein [Pseudomonadota bacterium]
MPRILTIVVIMFLSASAHAQEPPTACVAEDMACLFDMIEKTANDVTEDNWRDATYRETAKLLSHKGQTDRAIALLGKIKSPDTKALTIRGIGMAAADEKLPREEYAALFAKLTEEAKKIDHPPSHAIALTYISMAQAFAGDNDGALKTAATMDNASLRNKAYGEAGEIQAQRGDIAAVLKSVAAIDDTGYKDKELRIISKVFADGKYFDHALRTAYDIENPYQKSQAFLYVLLKQITPEEASVE